MKGFYGEFGGQFVAETLIPCLDELENTFNTLKKDKKFKNELNYLLKHYAGRPTPVYYCKNLSKKYNIEIYFKREDLLHTGAHKINNTLGQALLAKYIGKKRVIAETGAGQHGVATATVAALLDLQCTIYMGKIDAKRQKTNVDRMKLLGTEVRIVDSGSQTLKDAVSEALRDWVSSFQNTHYIIGSVVGPYPFPEIVGFFQSIIGKEAKAYFNKLGDLPDCVVACVGGGSNAIGIFKAFLNDNVELIGVEAGGIDDNIHARSISKGKKGIFQGSLSYVLQDKSFQIKDVHSISAGLDYPGVGPEHAYLHSIGRVEYSYATDEDALFGFFECSKNEGIIPALESSHAIGFVLKNKDRFKGKRVLINLSGRGDKDMGIIENYNRIPNEKFNNEQ